MCCSLDIKIWSYSGRVVGRRASGKWDVFLLCSIYWWLWPIERVAVLRNYQKGKLNSFSNSWAFEIYEGSHCRKPSNVGVATAPLVLSASWVGGAEETFLQLGQCSHNGPKSIIIFHVCNSHRSLFPFHARQMEQSSVFCPVQIWWNVLHTSKFERMRQHLAPS